jgi:glyoxylase-like metal-dependent hydrolase (beta-lactamase superfamily II)
VATDLPVGSPWFELETIDQRVTRLWEPYVDPFLESNVWHVRGSERHLVIDAGNGVGRLGPALEPLLDRRPAVAIVTHAHFDHVGCFGEFTERRCHELDASMPAPGPLRLLRDHFPDWLVEDFHHYGSELPETLALRAVPEAGFDPATWSTPRAAATSFVADGDGIDLGDRTIEVLHTPGHTPGSVSLWDPTAGALFTGDAFYVDAPLGWEDREAFDASLRRIVGLPVRVAHTGHGRSVDGTELRDAIADMLRR